jgi:hypothetical protein
MQMVASGKVTERAGRWHVASQTNVGGHGYKVNPLRGVLHLSHGSHDHVRR